MKGVKRNEGNEGKTFLQSKSIQQFLFKSSNILKASDYDKLGRLDAPLVEKKRWSEKKKLIDRNRKLKLQLTEQRKRLEEDKKSRELSNSARKRKIKAITEWTKREHPIEWKRIVQKILLKDIILKGEPWKPQTIVSYNDMDKIRELRKQDPDTWTGVALAKKFRISSFAIHKILQSKFSPESEKVVLRDEIVKEYRNLIHEEYVKEGKREQMRLFEEDLQSRYGSLYQPPTRATNNNSRFLFEKIESEMDGEEDEDEDEDEEGTKLPKKTHRTLLLDKAKENVTKRMEKESYKKEIEFKIKQQREKEHLERQKVAFYEGITNKNYKQHQKELEEKKKSFFNLGDLSVPFAKTKIQNTSEPKKFAIWKPLKSSGSSKLPPAFA